MKFSPHTSISFCWVKPLHLQSRGDLPMVELSCPPKKKDQSPPSSKSTLTGSGKQVQGASYLLSLTNKSGHSSVIPFHEIPAIPRKYWKYTKITELTQINIPQKTSRINLLNFKLKPYQSSDSGWCCRQQLHKQDNTRTHLEFRKGSKCSATLTCVWQV